MGQPGKYAQRSQPVFTRLRAAKASVWRPKIARAHMQVLNEIKPFHGDDFNALKDFWYELRCSVTNLQANGGEGEIQCGSNLERLVSKLPIALRRQWGGYVHRLRPTQPTLRDLETFLERAVESEEYAQPSANGASPKPRQIATVTKPSNGKFCFLCKTTNHMYNHITITTYNHM